MTALDYKLQFDQQQQRASTTRRSSDRTHRMLRTHEYNENQANEDNAEKDLQIVQLNVEGCVIAFLCLAFLMLLMHVHLRMCDN
jgi:lipid II:glycine glycyltransferase (peptidoglycan interpeptide bridge formation enzyme)